MSSKDQPMDQGKDNSTSGAKGHIGVVFGHWPCLTREAKWLCLDNIFQKFYRPNFYDVGGTYIDDVPDFWFMYKTEQCGNVFLLHLFVSNRHEGGFCLYIDTSSDLKINKKNNSAYVLKSPKYFELQQKEMNPNYLTTYHFDDLDVAMLKDRNLYIGVSLSVKKDPFQSKYLDQIKAGHDFGALLADPVGSDFTIESSEGAKIRVHKVFLAYHSEVFKAMLKDETAESQNSFVKLVDVSTEDLRHILEFIYTGTVTDHENCNFINLLICADRYNLPGLLELSQYALQHQLSIDNILEVLVVADMYNAEELKLATFKFIKKNASLFSGSVLKELNNEQLTRELYEYIVFVP